jgi:hypothetical protein
MGAAVTSDGNVAMLQRAGVHVLVVHGIQCWTLKACAACVPCVIQQKHR